MAPNDFQERGRHSYKQTSRLPEGLDPPMRCDLKCFLQPSLTLNGGALLILVSHVPKLTFPLRKIQPDWKYWFPDFSLALKTLIFPEQLITCDIH